MSGDENAATTATDGNEKLPERSARSKMRMVLVASAAVGALLAGLAAFLFKPHVVTGGHMEPTIKVGATVWAVPASGDSVARGDIVIWESKDNRFPTQVRVSRVIAIGGDTIESRDNDLYLNGEVIDEPYAAPDPVRFRIPVPPTRCLLYTS
ncbi:MAG: signal peptidase I, partial [Acidimicrobiales bacterium]|nr:signal peptidase I [Acidimicrobiales bacterium]